MGNLMRVGINIHIKHHRAVHEYINAAIDVLTDAMATPTTFDQMGWKKGGHFLLANVMYHAHKDEKEEVPCSEELERRAKLMSPQGTYRDWAVAANQLFQTGFEGQAFALLCSFAAPLMHFLSNSGGCIVHQVSPTGQGKSMGLRGAWTVWGAEHAIDLNRVDTQNSRFREISLLKHLPIIFDELQDRDEGFTKDFILSFTDGRDKRRLGVDGKERPVLGGWSTVIISASNKSLAQAVMTEGEQAQAARVLEYHSVLPEGTDPKKGAKLEKVLEANRGQAGERYIGNIVEPAIYQWIGSSCQKWNEHYVDKLGRGTEHRFYGRLLACCHVAGVMLNHWEMLEFDVERIVNFGFEAASGNRRAIIDAIPQYPRSLQDFINKNGRSMLYVNDEADSNPEVRPQSGELIMRMERRSKYGWIDRRAMRDWCTKNHIVFNEMEKDLVAKEVIIADTMKNLGLNTPWASAGAIPCWRVNLMSRHLGQLELVSDKAVARWNRDEMERDARERL